MVRLLFDFPSNPAGTPVRRRFSDPARVISADRIDEVIPALREVEEEAARGRVAAGYVSYEAAPAFDRAFRVRPGNRMPLLWFGIFEGEDLESDSHRAPDPSAAIPASSPIRAADAWRLDVTRPEYDEAVRRIRDAIARGRTYQVNYTARMTARLQRGRHPANDPDLRSLALYRRLREAQGGGYHAYLRLPGHTIVSVSPELFFHFECGTLTTRPMKGTAPRGRWLDEDRSFARKLAESEKERAENRMIVDLLRNDVGRVADVGSVEVTDLFRVERYRTVFQLTSTISGRISRRGSRRVRGSVSGGASGGVSGRVSRRVSGHAKPDANLVDVFSSLFPSGSVTGAPKIHTMGIIADLESSPREVYCGAIGFVDGRTGTSTFSVPIRTLWIDDETGLATYGVGGGITWDSTARGEYDELRAKAHVLAEPSPDFALIETLRLEDGEYARLDDHLRRLSESAAYFDRPFPEDAIREALESVATSMGEGETESATESATESGADEKGRGRRRVRLTLDADGSVKVEEGEIESGRERAMDPEGAAANRAEARALPRVALARRPIDPGDRFLYHKTTRREVHDSHRAERPDAFDVLLWNPEGNVTEFTFGNVVAEVAGRRITPPRTAGLLAGCYRAELLESGQVELGEIHLSDLQSVDRLWHVNSVREWTAVRLNAADVHPDTTDAEPAGDTRPRHMSLHG